MRQVTDEMTRPPYVSPRRESEVTTWVTTDRPPTALMHHDALGVMSPESVTYDPRRVILVFAPQYQCPGCGEQLRQPPLDHWVIACRSSGRTSADLTVVGQDEAVPVLAARGACGLCCVQSYVTYDAQRVLLEDLTAWSGRTSKRGEARRFVTRLEEHMVKLALDRSQTVIGAKVRERMVAVRELLERTWPPAVRADHVDVAARDRQALAVAMGVMQSLVDRCNAAMARGDMASVRQCASQPARAKSMRVIERVGDVETRRQAASMAESLTELYQDLRRRAPADQAVQWLRERRAMITAAADHDRWAVVAALANGNVVGAKLRAAAQHPDPAVVAEAASLGASIAAYREGRTVARG